jgi:hypothetical protein
MPPSCREGHKSLTPEEMRSRQLHWLFGGNPEARWIERKGCALRLACWPRVGNTGHSRRRYHPKIIEKATDLLREDGMDVEHKSVKAAIMSVEGFEKLSGCKPIQKQKKKETSSTTSPPSPPSEASSTPAPETPMPWPSPTSRTPSPTEELKKPQEASDTGGSSSSGLRRNSHPTNEVRFKTKQPEGFAHTHLDQIRWRSRRISPTRSGRLSARKGTKC